MSYPAEIRQNYAHFLEVVKKPKGDILLDGSNGPCVVAHGVAGSYPQEGIFGYMTAKAVKGRLLNFGLMEKGIEHYIPHLKNALDENPGALVVAYSAGGLLALETAKRYGFDGIKKMITVATPFEGINRLSSVFGGTFKDIAKGSRLLEDITSLKPPQGKVVSVFAEKDMFSPPPARKLNWETRIVGAKNHGNVQSDVKWIEDILDTELKLK